jgi:hypothetical protein
MLILNPETDCVPDDDNLLLGKDAAVAPKANAPMESHLFYRYCRNDPVNNIDPSGHDTSTGTAVEPNQRVPDAPTVEQLEQMLQGKLGPAEPVPGAAPTEAPGTGEGDAGVAAAPFYASLALAIAAPGHREFSEVSGLWAARQLENYVKWGWLSDAQARALAKHLEFGPGTQKFPNPIGQHELIDAPEWSPRWKQWLANEKEVYLAAKKAAGHPAPTTQPSPATPNPTPATTQPAPAAQGGGASPPAPPAVATSQPSTQPSTQPSAANNTPYIAKPGEVVDPTKVDVYRGGADWTLKPYDYRVDKSTGYVREYGPSVNTDAADANVIKYGGPHKITSLPDELQIIRRSTTAGTHLEVVPKSSTMTPQRFQELLYQIKID